MFPLKMFTGLNFFNYQSGCYTFGLSSPKLLNSFVFWLNKTSAWSSNYLVDIVAADLIFFRTKTHKNFKNINLLGYFFVNIVKNFRVQILFMFDKTTSIQSLTNLFFSADWAEREVWDLFGIIFFNHNDLRRILTDYGFVGHPLQKQFPVTGFVEQAYNENFKNIFYKPVNKNLILRANATYVQYNF